LLISEVGIAFIDVPIIAFMESIRCLMQSCVIKYYTIQYILSPGGQS